MKSRTVFTIILSCILVAVVAASYVEFTAASSPHSFTLTLTGSAYDSRLHKNVHVVLYLRGMAYGNLKSVVTLYSSGGNVKVDCYGTFPVSRGCGTLVQRCHYICFTIKVTSKYYGGKIAVWCLKGRTGTLHGRALPVSFWSCHVTLPAQGYPTLYNLWLKGTMAPIY
jgi:hypothetical protein